MRPALRRRVAALVGTAFLAAAMQARAQLLNLTAECALPAGWTLYARGTNIVDKHYELAADYNTPGTSIFAGFRYRY
jgi:outer membrane cobalamin receptor